MNETTAYLKQCAHAATRDIKAMSKEDATEEKREILKVKREAIQFIGTIEDGQRIARQKNRYDRYRG